MRPLVRYAAGAAVALLGALALSAALIFRMLPGGGSPLPPGDAPDVGSDGSVRFLAVGDVGEANPRSAKIARSAGRWCAEHQCDFAVFLGDNLYPSGMEHAADPRMNEVFDPWLETGVPLYLVLGNHDYDNGLGRDRAMHQIAWAAATPGAELPAPRYTFSAENADFFALDTQEIFWNGGATHASWLSEALDPGGARWRIAFGHHPYRSNGRHGNAGTYEGSSLLPYISGGRIRDFFESSICGQVDIYLSGHEHNLQWIESCGTHFVISGAGAKVTPRVERGNTSRFEAYAPGAVWLHLQQTEAHVVFLDAEGAVLHEERFRRSRQ